MTCNLLAGYEYHFQWYELKVDGGLYWPHCYQINIRWPHWLLEKNFEGNCLGFLVHQHGIRVNKYKAKEIIKAKPANNKKHLWRLFGQVTCTSLSLITQVKLKFSILCWKWKMERTSCGNRSISRLLIKLRSIFLSH